MLPARVPSGLPPAGLDAGEALLAHKLLYAVKDVGFADKRGRLAAWEDAIQHVGRMHRRLDEQHERIKVLEAERSGQATPIRRGRV